MIKPIAPTFAAAFALSPIGAGAAETAGGGTAAPPEGSPGPGAGATAPPGQGAVRIPGTAVGRVPHPMQAPPLGQNRNDCVKTACDNSNGGG